MGEKKDVQVDLLFKKIHGTTDVLSFKILIVYLPVH